MHTCVHARVLTCIQACVSYLFEDSWFKLAPEEMKEFEEAHGHLPVSELAAEMKVFIAMKKSIKVSGSTGSKGNGKPLSVSRREGYNTEQLENIEKAADKEWDAILGSFVYVLRGHPGEGHHGGAMHRQGVGRRWVPSEQR